MTQRFGSYITLTCTTVLDKGGFLVIVSIPMLDNMNTFEIFNIFNMPVPVKDPVVPTDKISSMVVSLLYIRDFSNCCYFCSVAVNLTELLLILHK